MRFTEGGGEIEMGISRSEPPWRSIKQTAAASDVLYSAPTSIGGLVSEAAAAAKKQKWQIGVGVGVGLGVPFLALLGVALL